MQPGAQLSGAGEVLKKIAFRQVGVQRSCHGPILRSWSCGAEDIFNSGIVRLSMWHAGLLDLLTSQGELVV